MKVEDKAQQPNTHRSCQRAGAQDTPAGALMHAPVQLKPWACPCLWCEGLSAKTEGACMTIHCNAHKHTRVAARGGGCGAAERRLHLALAESRTCPSALLWTNTPVTLQKGLQQCLSVTTPANACSRLPPAHAPAVLLHIPLLLPGPTKPRPACCKLQGSCLSLCQLQAVPHPHTREYPRARGGDRCHCWCLACPQVWASVVTGWHHC